MTELAFRRPPLRNAPNTEFPRIGGLHHVAYRCKNAEETRRFYEDILKLPLVAVVHHDHVPSTGEYSPYFHLFFEMADGSCIAFFDLYDGNATVPDPATPAWVNHLALQVADEAALLDAKQRLEKAGVSVIGPAVHEAIKSIYFFDPNGIRIELTCIIASREQLLARVDRAHAAMKDYEQLAAKARAGRPA
ncbi:MAG: hypothetical protein BGP05_02240 [Rhizobiales bacterium 62-47]|nr:VOC family protein [Hyphomicrobiales bacterium]OJY12777.1 MAG: hypothetical protein BGP05_02240 [Rhizobiales bacterium 62-47]